MNKKIIVFDLDGTFYNCNTFHKWILYSSLKEISHFNFIYPIKISYFVLLRILNKITHSTMKYRILKEGNKIANQQYIERFLDYISRYINKYLEEKLKSDNSIFILATAAPELYVKEIAQRYGFTYFTATKNIGIKGWKENIRDEKKRSLLMLFKNHGIKEAIDILYTDHHDDIPIMLMSQKIFLINPSETTVQRVLNALKKSKPSQIHELHRSISNNLFELIYISKYQG